MAKTLYIPCSNGSTCLSGLISVFVNKWSGSKTTQIFVEKEIMEDGLPLFKIISKDLIVAETDINSMTTLPMMFIPEHENLSDLVVSGLAAVCRQLIKHSENEAAIKALGFRSNCLQAPAEVSIWTAFCEVQMPASALCLLSSPCPENTVELPDSLVLFEEHLKQPVRMHNVVKRWQKEPGAAIDHKAKDSSKLAQTSLSHTFAEGPDMTIADLLLYPSVKIVSSYLSGLSIKLEDYLPRVNEWILTMDPIVREAWSLTVEEPCIKDLSTHLQALRLEPLVVQVAHIKDKSLYRKDPGRQGVGALTDEDVNAVVATMKNQRLWPLDHQDLDLPAEFRIDVSQSTSFTARVAWSSLPDPAHPKQGHVPGSRLDRKIEQLDNMVAAVMDAVVDGDSIVDFCSGGGHLGIVLAHLLPRCKVIMIDNKEESVRNARHRVAQLKLSNVTLIQSNLDYFNGKFNLGVALHACGVATDLVLHMCLANRASFVLCPCCYGNLALDLPIQYPQSQLFRQRSVMPSDFANLARMADHVTPVGRSSMAAVDLDRIARASQEGYTVTLKKLKPDSCTPKHDLLIGTV